jgi:hypothetical protein
MSEYIPLQWMYGDGEDQNDHVLVYRRNEQYLSELALSRTTAIELLKLGAVVSLSHYFAWKGENTFDGELEDEYLDYLKRTADDEEFHGRPATDQYFIQMARMAEMEKKRRLRNE